ncbi:GntR family transcriptional regulator [Deinococcus oregonensis]|uniref:GntR family transcriptional regulator n=1 Tax=Deinococcus oregonensis TaxID=1805970 RepID=A0ABV6AVU0_9DEIO
MKSPASLPLERLRATPDLVADHLRAEINAGVYAGGQALPQEELAARFGISRQPVREALRRLEAEGLIVLQPHRGAVVTNPSRREAAEAYELRALLEPEALRRSAPHFTRAGLRRAAHLLDDLDEAADRLRWRELDNAFHSALYEGADRPRLLEWIGGLRAVVNRYFDLHLTPQDYAARSQEGHREILAACQAGNTEKAVSALQAHLKFAAALIPDKD